MTEQFAEIKNETNSEKPKLSKGVLVKVGVALLVVGVIVAGYLVYTNSQNLTPEVQAAEETAKAVEKIGRLIALPEGETPTLATVTDPAQLKDQPFFAKAEIGFQVLLYPNAQKAFLYDPKKDIIVEVATLNLGQ
ncbi:hypothetical protein K2P56_05200 [Patescibacteria group bacterium]|nr:hypothetical protein [Patescibacteria group bacterium]